MSDPGHTHPLPIPAGVEMLARDLERRAREMRERAQRGESSTFATTAVRSDK